MHYWRYSYWTCLIIENGVKPISKCVLCDLRHLTNKSTFYVVDDFKHFHGVQNVILIKEAKNRFRGLASVKIIWGKNRSLTFFTLESTSRKLLKSLTKEEADLRYVDFSSPLNAYWNIINIIKQLQILPLHESDGVIHNTRSASEITITQPAFIRKNLTICKWQNGWIYRNSRHSFSRIKIVWVGNELNRLVTDRIGWATKWNCMHTRLPTECNWFNFIRLPQFWSIYYRSVQIHTFSIRSISILLRLWRLFR